MEIGSAPEDFIVREIPPTGRPLEIRRGQFLPHSLPWTEAVLLKRNWGTLEALKFLSAKFGGARFSFAGNKDRPALTVQRVAFRGVSVRRLASFRGRGLLFLSAKGRSGPLRLGELLGNRFEVGVSKFPELPNSFANFFGPQRFGREGVNHLVGRALLLGDFQAAVETFLIGRAQTPWRRILAEEWAVEEVLRDFTPPRWERQVLLHLASNPSDFAGALRRLPRRLLTLFLHAYQSYLFNLYLLRREGPQEGEKRGGSHLGFPEPQRSGEDYLFAWLPGYRMRLNRLWVEILGEEGIRPEDFRIPGMPEISSPGHLRPVFLRPLDVSFGRRLAFSLPKGGFATVLLGLMGGKRFGSSLLEGIQPPQILAQSHRFLNYQ